MMKKILLPIGLLLTAASPVNLEQSNRAVFGQQPAQDLQLYLPDDLEATLWAESPLVYNPTNMDVDIRGRIWVTEAVNYRNFNNDSTQFFHHSHGDRVMILEDTDQDGKADKSTVFVEDRDLTSPLGIAVIGNKVVVSCAPNLIVYTDDNGDDKPDRKEILLTGFGGFDHDHSLHSVVVGPDGKWYFNTGNAGPHVVTDKSGWTLRSGSLYTGGTPYNEKNQGNQVSDDGKVWVGGLQLRVNPDGTGLKVLAHNFRNSYETCVDSRGDLWQNDNDDQVVTCRVSWLMEGGNAGYFSADGTRSWNADQRPGQDMFTAHWHQEDPGVMPAGDNSGAGSPTGIVRNEGDVLGEHYRGLLLSADAGRNVIYGYKPELTGSGYDLKGKRTNFITSSPQDDQGYVWNNEKFAADQTKWFRPSDVMIGTDGAIYIADWYDAVVGGHQMKDTKGYGRIYRITPKGKKLTAPQLNLATTSGQLDVLKNPAVNVRGLGFAALKARGNKALKSVKTLLASSNPYHQARAVWLLSQLGAKGVAEVEKILASPDEKLRATAYRAMRQVRPGDQILPLAEKMSSDPSALIRREVAVSLRDLPYEKIKNSILQIVKTYDGKDRYYLEAIGAALDGKSNGVSNQISNLIVPDFDVTTQKNREIWKNVLWRLRPMEEIGTFEALANDRQTPETERKLFITALAFIKDKKAAEAMLALSKSPLKDVAEQATYWLAFRQSNDWFDLLDWSKTGLNLAQEKKIAEAKANREKLLNEHIAFGDRKNTAQQLAKDSVGGQMLIGMVAEQKLPADLLAAVEELIFNNPDPVVRVQASQYFKRPGVGKIYDLKAIATLTPEVSKGRQLFATHCASCHKAGKQGAEIGPELTRIRQKFDKLGLLDAIVNPSAGIVFGYEPWLLTSTDGSSVYGFLVADGPQTVVIKDMAGHKHVLATRDIRTRKKQQQSLMPDPIALGLTEKDLANLTEYLLTLTE
jgi:putative membrane-bound dehydrogenase-like protein